MAAVRGAKPEREAPVEKKKPFGWDEGE